MKLEQHQTQGAPTVKDRVVVRVPASTANLGPGFDSLGMALSLFSWVDLRPSTPEEGTTVTLLGDQVEGVATDKTNLVYVVAQEVFARAGVKLPELHITLRSDIPLTRGLGSSASAIVGALFAANELIGSPFTVDELFQMATAEENHPDNVGASLFGGIIAAAWDGTRAEAVRLNPPEALEALVVIPEFELSTKKARTILPQQLSLKDAVFNVSHSSLLTAALATGRLDLLRHAMRDKLHQPYRASLVPGMDAILRDAADHGALGAVLSGAGPTLLLLADSGSSDREEMVRFVTDAMAAEGISVTTQWLLPWPHGPEAVVLDSDDPKFELELSELLPVPAAAEVVR
ncbi:homoserine kinase [Cohnella thailandensis]|uniref:Homoserine kinase n=1 Tax=Cohnella thailandensis TaxID=557557 RepID=A0A841STL6_9BACL|nr:homoserine kinase [Cohnella thailandensis]MBB6633936.1 homoserine kinase [Cohnella thailandensis]MBP1972619.1 homoserine kinase [Cohnella thailandensis]